MKNNFAYIDGQNLHFGIKSLGWKLDHRKFRQYLEEEHGVSKAFIFLGYMEEHQDLYNVLQEAGFICFFKPLVRYDDGTIKGNVDADMVLQVMLDVEKYDKAVIISGDGDFSSLLRHLMSRDKLGQVIIPNRDKYSSLFDRLDGFNEKQVTYMNDLRNRLSYRPGHKQHYKSKPHTNGTGGEKKGSSEPSKKAIIKPTTKSEPKKAAHASKRTLRKSAAKPKKAESGFKPKSELEKSLIDTINSAE